MRYIVIGAAALALIPITLGVIAAIVAAASALAERYGWPSIHDE